MNRSKEKHFHAPISFKKWALYFLATVLLVRIVYYTATEGFCPDRICDSSSTLQTHPQKKESPPFPPELKNGSFSYLKKGSQAYAFESADKKYVLKLFKRHHMQEALWLHSVPTFGPLTSWKDLLIHKRTKRLQLSIKSYVLATSFLQRQCGILSYQLEPSSTHNLTVTLIDGIGRKHNVLLDRCGYVLQYKASLIFPTLSSWIDKNDFESAQKALRSLVSSISERSQMGIQDVDPDLHKNAGFLGTEALFIDIGSFTQHEKPLSKETFAYDIRKISKELSLWLKMKDQHIALFFEQCIEKAIQEYPS